MERIFIIAIVCFYSCASSKHIVGKYASTKSPDSFQLNSDSTFIYQYRAYHAYEHATGKWKMMNNSTVVLNSTIQNIIIPSFLTITNNISDPTNTILTFEPRIKEGILSDYKCEIFINDSLFETRRLDAIKKMQINKPINTILFKIIKEPLKSTSTYFPLFPLCTEKFVINRNGGVDINITSTIDNKLFGYHVFMNEVIKVNNKGIRRFYLTNNKWRIIPKVPDDSNIFIEH